MKAETCIAWDVGIKNLAFCIMEINEDRKWTIIDWGIICLSDSDCESSQGVSNKTKKTTPDINKIVVSLIENLANMEKENKFKNITTVMIENQPTVNKIMKSISVMILTYFTTLKIKRRGIYGENDIFSVKFVSSQSKLSMEFKGFEVSKTLSNNKKLHAIKTAEYILDNRIDANYKNNGDDVKYDKILKKFKTSRKKDDLADSFLYCIWHGYSKNYKKKK